MNPLKEIRLAKVTLNMGVGESGPKIDKAKKILKKITGKQPVTALSKRRNPFGVSQGRPIGAKVTLRKEEAREALEKLLQAKNNRLKDKCFDHNGNLSFGIEEYINLPGISYDPEVGIMGMDVAVTLERPGFRVKKRKIRPSQVGDEHRISKQEAVNFIKQNFKVKVD